MCRSSSFRIDICELTRTFGSYEVLLVGNVVWSHLGGRSILYTWLFVGWKFWKDTHSIGNCKVLSDEWHVSHFLKRKYKVFFFLIFSSLCLLCFLCSFRSFDSEIFCFFRQARWTSCCGECRLVSLLFIGLLYLSKSFYGYSMDGYSNVLRFWFLSYSLDYLLK